MRLDVKKVLFFGHRTSLEHFFLKAQESALIQFIGPKGKKVQETTEEIEKVIEVIKTLRNYPAESQEELESLSEAGLLVQKILNLKQAMQGLEEEKKNLKIELERLAVFGQFSLEDIKAIEQNGDFSFQFFFSKKKSSHALKQEEGLIYIASDEGLDYFIAVNKHPVSYENCFEMHFLHEYNDLKERLAVVEREFLAREALLKSFAKYEVFLHRLLAEEYNGFNLEKTKEFVEEKMHGQIFVIQGWVPGHHLPLLHQIMKEEEVEMVEIAKDESDVVPTYLENEGLGKIGEDLVHVYDTPSNDDKDPSLWLLFSFALFFAMIINDAGYGIVFLLAAVFFRYKNSKLSSAAKRIWVLSMLLFSCCIGWGVLTNSFFGINIAPDHHLRKYSLVNALVEKKAEYHFVKQDAVYKEWAAKFPKSGEATDANGFLMGAEATYYGVPENEMITKFSDGILMELALLVGMIHITLSFLRYLFRNWSGLGWIFVIWGAYFYFPIMLKATSLFHYAFGLDKEFMAHIGLQFIYLGLGVAVLCAVIRNKFLGLLEITNAIQIFADILSYLRLYALGLAGAIISMTLNDIVSSMGFFSGFLLLVIGHGLNMILAIVGGIIHGLRLNFIEWYHYSFEGGGKPFRPLRYLE